MIPSYQATGQLLSPIGIVVTLAFMIAIFLNAEGNAFTAVEIYSVHPSLENCAAEVKEIREGWIYLKGTAPVWLDCVTFENPQLILKGK